MLSDRGDIYTGQFIGLTLNMSMKGLQFLHFECMYINSLKLKMQVCSVFCFVFKSSMLEYKATHISLSKFFLISLYDTV